MNYFIDSPPSHNYNSGGVASLSTLNVTSYANNVVAALHYMTLCGRRKPL